MNKLLSTGLKPIIYSLVLLFAFVTFAFSQNKTEKEKNKKVEKQITVIYGDSSDEDIQNKLIKLPNIKGKKGQVIVIESDNDSLPMLKRNFKIRKTESNCCCCCCKCGSNYSDEETCDILMLDDNLPCDTVIGSSNSMKTIKMNEKDGKIAVKISIDENGKEIVTVLEGKEAEEFFKKQGDENLDIKEMKDKKRKVIIIKNCDLKSDSLKEKVRTK